MYKKIYNDKKKKMKNNCHLAKSFYDGNKDYEIECLLLGKRFMIYGNYKPKYLDYDFIMYDTATLKEIKNPIQNQRIFLFQKNEQKIIEIFLNICKKYEVKNFNFSGNTTKLDIIMGIFLGYRIFDIIHYLNNGIKVLLFDFDRLNNNPNGGNLAKKLIDNHKPLEGREYDKVLKLFLEILESCKDFAKDTKYYDHFNCLYLCFLVNYQGI